MFAREGYLIIGIATILAVILIILGFQLSAFWRAAVFVLAALVLAFTLYFFRDPARTTPDSEGGKLVFSPADGKVVVVSENVREPLYIHGPAKQISIFLSPLNVHVNRAPVDGVVEYVRYVPGDYLVAWHPKASEQNERSEIGVRHPSGRKILFKQIAGAVARRIVYHLQVGDTVVAGDRFGIVKFGSRMDVLVPPDVEILVSEGESVQAGVTILGRIPDAPPAVDTTSEDTAAADPAGAETAGAASAGADTGATNTTATGTTAAETRVSN